MFCVESDTRLNVLQAKTIAIPSDTALATQTRTAQLQDKVEVLPNVGRAFVHIDHETTHKPVSFIRPFIASRREVSGY